MNINVEAGTIAALLLGMCRATGFMLIAPPFNTKSVPPQAKALFSMVLTIAMLPTIRADIGPEPTFALMVGGAVSELVLGAALGFLVSLLFSAVQVAGDLIDLASGFALQPAFDPQAMTMHSSIGKLHSLMATTLLFTSGGHLMLVRGFAMSYDALPLAGGLPTHNLGPMLVHGISTMFLSALQIAGPMIAVLFLTDMALALLSKAAPGLQVFQLGMPLKMFMVLGLLALTIPLLPAAVQALVTDGIRMMLHLGGAG